MEDRLQELYEKANSVKVGYLYYQSRKNTDEVKEIVSQIQEFVLWFLDGNQFGIEDELYGDMCKDLLLILQDIVSAMEQGDHVLLHDALAYGLMNYLELFVSGEDEIDDVV